MLTGDLGIIENQIKNWVRQNVCRVDADHGRCKKIVVRHLNLDKKPTGDVCSINVASDPAFEGTEIADKIIIEIAEGAQRDANDLKAGVQTYGIFCYYTGSASYVPRKIFRVAAEEDFDPDGGPSEPPTEKGLLQQLMRHNEINAKNGMVGMGYIMQTLQKDNAEGRQMIREYMRQQLDTTILLQDVLNESHKRRQEEKKTEMEMGVIEGVFEHLKVALPIFINRLAGKEVFPAKMDRELYMMASFFEALDAEQQNTIRNMLKPQQLAVLAEILGMYEEKKFKLTGEKPAEEGEPKKISDDSNGATKKPNKLLTLFEKRKVLVENGSNEIVRDEVARRIEEKAAKIRDRLKNIVKIGEPDQK